MLTNPFASTLLVAAIAPATALLPATLPVRALSQAEAAALSASFDPSLGALRAGRVESPASFGAHEHSVLAAAQSSSPSLAALRAGFEPSDNEWKWFAIGGLVLLLIVLL